jgi:hypothetical protein
MANYSSGDLIPLWINKDATANAPTAQIRRVSDGYYLDFNDDTFKASAWTTPSVTLTDNTTEWSYSWNSNALPTDEAACIIEYTVDNVVYCEELQLNLAASGGGGATAQQVWEYATRTLTSGAAPSAAAIADAIWDETRTSHATVGSFGEALQIATGSIPGLVWDVLAADHSSYDTFGYISRLLMSSTQQNQVGMDAWDSAQPIAVTFDGTIPSGSYFIIFVMEAALDQIRRDVSYTATPLGRLTSDGANHTWELDWTGSQIIDADAIGIAGINGGGVISSGSMNITATSELGAAIVLDGIIYKERNGGTGLLARDKTLLYVNNYFRNASTFNADAEALSNIAIALAQIPAAVDAQLSNTHTSGAWGLPRNWRPK